MNEVVRGKKAKSAILETEQGWAQENLPWLHLCSGYDGRGFL